MDTTLFIVPCSATKSPVLSYMPMRAGDSYTGQAFKMAKGYLQRANRKWCILSGHYGFLWPDTIIENYDVKMEPVDADTVWDDCFDHITNRQYARLMTAERVIVLGSSLYADAAAVLLNRPVEAPLAGLPIGKMLSELSRATWLSTPVIK